MNRDELERVGWRKRSAGDHRGAAEAFRRVLARQPDHVAAASGLALTLYELGEAAEALALFERAARLAPDLPDVHVNLATALATAGDTSRALGSLERALELCPQHQLAWANLGRTLERAGELAWAEAALARAVELEPLDWQSVVSLAALLVRRGQAPAALQLAERRLAAKPAHSALLALLHALCLDLDPARAAALAPARFVQERQLRPPPGFAGRRGFLAALAGQILGHPTLVASPRSHATVAGSHSGELLSEARGALAALEGVLHEAVSDYVRALPCDDPHPFVAYRPGRTTLHVWAVVLRDGGYQLPHVHPDAWLSGVLYVRVPSAIERSPERAGWLELGRSDPALGLPSAPSTYVEPAAGKLVLLPSFAYHSTVPHRSDEPRISVAFDVVPADLD